MANTLTGANSSIAIGITNLYTVPQNLQGFAADDVTQIADLKTAEIMTGVDGNLSGGYVYVPVVQEITLQGDSLSNLLFDAWFAAQDGINELYYANGVIHLPAVSRSYVLTKGILTSYKPMSDVKKLLQARKFEITWQSIVVAPI
jgi:hypothetical protein